MLSRRIAVRPVHKAALSVPNVFSVKSNSVAFIQVIYPGSELDIVLYEYSLAGGEADDESLVRAA
jgi:hypothetical protein